MKSIELGKKLLFYRQSDLALVHLKLAIDEEPENGEAWKTLGKCLLIIGKNDEAEKALMKASEIIPDDTEIWLLLGVIYRDSGQKSNEIECYNKTQNLGLSAVEMFRTLGSIYLAMKHLIDAEEYLLRSYDIEREDAETCYMLGNLEHMRQNADKSEEYVLKAIVLNPNKFEYCYLHGSIYRTLRKDFQKAVNIFERCLTLGSERFEIWNDLGISYMKLGNWQKARECLLKAIEIDANNYFPFYNLACVASLDGKIDEAIEYLQKAFELAPERIRKRAPEDEDLRNLWSNPRFIHFFLEHIEVQEES